MYTMNVRTMQKGGAKAPLMGTGKFSGAQEFIRFLYQRERRAWLRAAQAAQAAARSKDAAAKSAAMRDLEAVTALLKPRVIERKAAWDKAQDAAYR